MSSVVLDRRASPRQVRLETHGLDTARVRPGYAVTVVDVGASGALLDTAHRLLPGACVELQWQRDGRWSDVARGRVVRCSVAGLDPNGVRYRGAVVFDRAVRWFPKDEVPG